MRLDKSVSIEIFVHYLSEQLFHALFRSLPEEMSVDYRLWFREWSSILSRASVTNFAWRMRK